MNEQVQALMFDAARVLMRDPAVTNHPWTGIAVVFQVPEADASHYAVFGYRYNHGDWEALFLDDESPFTERMLEFRTASQVPNDKPWCASLMQVTRTGMKLACDLEYDDPERWTVTPANLETRVGELRPTGA
jgi:hypothetical protein